MSTPANAGAPSTFPLIVRDDAVTIDTPTGATTVQNLAGGTVYYSDNPEVSSAQNLGSITAGGSHTFSQQAWIVATRAAPANCIVTIAGIAPSTLQYGSAKILYVDPSGSDAASGLSAGQAKATIAAAIAALPAAGGEVRLAPNSTFTMTSALSIDVTKVRLVGRQTVLDFTSYASSNPALVVTSSASTPYVPQQECPIEGVTLKGPGSGSSSTAVQFYGPNGNADVYGIRCLFDLITNWGTGVRFSSNAFCITIRARILNCATPVLDDGSSVANGGERVNFTDSMIFNCSGPLNLSNGNADYYFNNCSLDYFQPSGFLKLAGGVTVNLIDCHVETQPYALGANPLFTLQDYGTTLRMIGGRLLCSGTSPTNPYVVQWLAGSNGVDTLYGAATFDSVYMVCGFTTAFSSPGQTIIKNSAGHQGLAGPFPLGGPTDLTCLLPDGTCENTTVINDTFITADTAAITSRLNGTNLVLSNSTDINHTSGGSRSLKAAKAGGAGSNAEFCIVAPIDSRQTCGVSFWIATNAAVTGTFYWTVAYGCVVEGPNGVPTITKASTLIAQNSFNLPGSGTQAWTQLVGSTPYRRAPGWATHLVLDLNLVNMAAGSLYVDDVVFNQF